MIARNEERREVRVEVLRTTDATALETITADDVRQALRTRRRSAVEARLDRENPPQLLLIDPFGIVER